MKIHDIRICNFKGLNEDVRVNAKGCSILICGKNNQGKSSFIDGIWAALDGKNSPYQPINVNADKATTEICFVKDNGDKIRVERKFTQSGSALKISIGDDGFTAGQPASYLKKIVGKDVNFDPVEFASLTRTPKGRKLQSEMVQEILGINLSEYDEKTKRLKELRLESHRKKEQLKAEVKASAENMPENQDHYSQKLSINELLEQLESIKNVTSLLAQARAKKEGLISSQSVMEKSIADKKEQLKKLQEQIAQEEKQLTETKESISKCDAYIEKNKAAEDSASEINAKMKDIEAHNQKFELIESHKKLVEQFENEELNHKNLNANIKDIANQKLAAIDDSCGKLDLGKKIYINEDGLLYVDQVPIDQLNTAQQIELGMLLYMNTNPVLRVVRLEVSRLDNETLDSVLAIIKKYDFQAFLEKVDNQDDDLHINLIEE